MAAGITLAQLAQVEKEPEVKFIEMSLLRECKLLDLIPFVNVSSLRIRAQYWQKLPTGGAWRAVNDGYTSGEDGQLADAEEYLYAFGGDITFDRVMEMVKDTTKDPVQLQQEGKIRAMGLQWNDKFINGDVGTDPNSFDGLKKRVAGMPSRQSIRYTAGATDTAMDPTASAALARRFLNVLRKAKRYCNGGKVDAILCNEDFILGISAALVYAQATGNYLDTTKDQWGIDVVSYLGIPLIDVGYQSDLSTEVISNTETALDSGSDATSQYWISINQTDGIYGVQLNPFKAYDPLNGGEMESKPSKLRRIDWFNGIANFGTRGIVRTYNLSNLAGWTEGG